MPRYYYRSPLGIFLRLWAGTALVVLFFVGVQWFFLEVLPRILPFLMVGALVAAVFWLVSRLRRY